ncbi:MAG: ABC transporter ATP-binding protein [Armatimonadetes bacterium]|nr:ABC transporter ATP-binding protein [Armatimonadota bacterium]
MTLVLIAEGLVRRFGPVTAVDGVSLRVEEGSCFGLLGPNGAGKTSTIDMLVGLAKPDAGTVTFSGKLVTPDDSGARRQIGYVPQEIALYDDLSATANLQFFAGLYGIAGNERERRIREVLEVAGLTDRARDKVKHYSGGMKRRLNIAVSLLQRPKLLVLDEPTVGVDPQSRNAIFESLKLLQSQGLTLIYTTHYMEEVERLCDHIAIMDAGKVVAEGDLPSLYSLLPGQNTLTIGAANTSDASRILARVRSAGFQAEENGASVEISTEDLSAALGAVAEANREIPFTSLQTHKRTLEEVFLNLTGRSLRD